MYSHDEYPVMLAYATQEQEVSNLVKCGLSTGVQVVPRSGGHQ
jgi:FAD/FMN-containing dehydrogenase